MAGTQRPLLSNGTRAHSAQRDPVLQTVVTRSFMVPTERCFLVRLVKAFPRRGLLYQAVRRAAAVKDGRQAIT